MKRFNDFIFVESGVIFNKAKNVDFSTFLVYNPLKICILFIIKIEAKTW